ncbi:MAG: ribosome small subunit-dependent GTPase A [Candidatus Goldbacteria bacterium]|nr:ribosome small subunit-dependent GTPase A [Candidatus Goldiibacteriota bacterium]
MTLEQLGWDSRFEEVFEPFRKDGLNPARVIAEHRERYILHTGEAEIAGEVSGKFMFTAQTPSEYPKTGDWVAASVFPEESKAIIHNLVPRHTYFSRKAAGIKTVEQVMASNINTIFIVQGLDNNYNPMRLLRYAASIEGTGISPVVVLNKSDLNPDAAQILEKTKELLLSIPVLEISAKTGNHMSELKSFMREGMTSVFVGSSGAGKSTIINSLAGKQVAQTHEVREDDSRGRHTTVARQLYFIDNCGMVIDTPGIRELQLWDDDGKSAPEFDIVLQYAQKCRFKDCLHENEPGCAVKEAADKGLIPPEILKSYFKLKKEMEYTRSKVDEAAALERKQKEKKFGKYVKNVLKDIKEVKGR